MRRRSTVDESPRSLHESGIVEPRLLMRILALETVEITGSIAAFEGSRLLAEHALDPERRSAQTLAPGIERLLGEVGWRPADVELLAVASGPGSFTGLRIGVTTAKVFAYAVGCQVVGVHTLLAIASQVPEHEPCFSVVVDAQRGELFVADFTRDAGQLLRGHENTRIVPMEGWLRDLSVGAVLSGPGLKKAAAQLPAHVRLIDSALWAPRASAMARVGWRQFSAGQRDTAFDLVPQYFRRTAAEEQWAAKEAG